MRSFSLLSSLQSWSLPTTLSAPRSQSEITSQDQTIDPCGCACGPIGDALQTCANSTDINCGCDAWITSGPSCSACVGIVQSEFTSNITTGFVNTIFGVQIARAFCLCQDACTTVANATYQCGFTGSGIDCTCSVYERDGPACSSCIKGFDQYAGLMMDNYIASCTSGADFKNCTPSSTHVLIQ